MRWWVAGLHGFSEESFAIIPSLPAGIAWRERYRLGVSLPDRGHFCFCPAGIERNRLVKRADADGRPAGRRANVICAVLDSSTRIGLWCGGVAYLAPVAGSLAERAYAPGLGMRTLYHGYG